MVFAAAQLLGLLASGIQHAAAPARPVATPAIPAGATPFADLLKQAQAGNLQSALPVTLSGDAKTAGVSLSDDQLARLSFAADKLEAAGVNNALVTIDGQRVLLDVHQRQVTGPAANDSGITSGVDGAIDLGDLRSAGQAGAAAALKPGGPASLASNASLMNLLAQLNKGKQAT